MSRLLMRVAVERRALDAAVSRLRSAAGAARKRRTVSARLPVRWHDSGDAGPWMSESELDLPLARE